MGRPNKVSVCLLWLVLCFDAGLKLNFRNKRVVRKQTRRTLFVLTKRINAKTYTELLITIREHQTREHHNTAEWKMYLIHFFVLVWLFLGVRLRARTKICQLPIKWIDLKYYQSGDVIIAFKLALSRYCVSDKRMDITYFQFY